MPWNNRPKISDALKILPIVTCLKCSQKLRVPAGYNVRVKSQSSGYDFQIQT